MFYLYLLLILIPIIFHITTRYSRKGRLLRKIKGPPPYPIIGNTPMFLMSCPNKFWERVREITAEYYPIVNVWLFKTVVTSIRHPSDLEILLTSQKVIQKGYAYDYLHPWLKKGLLTSTGDLWHQRRKILTPAFHFNILKKYLEITNEQTQNTVIELKRDGKESIKNLEDFCSKFTLSVICESAMGVNLRSKDEEYLNNYHNAIHNMGSVIRFRTPRPYIYNWMMPYIYKVANLQKNALKCLHAFTKELIEERIKYHKNRDNKFLFDNFDGTDSDSALENKTGSKKRLCMLDLLLVAKENGQIDLNGIHEEVDTFTFEGHDTTGMALVYTLLLLAEHKEEQEKCRIEVSELLDKTNDPQLSDLQNLPYLERCIKESLRLYPPVSTLIRYTSEDLQLKHALIPGGTEIVMHLYDTHRDPNFWVEPNKFDPDRFLPENSKDRHAFAYVPFSAGPRNCIGQKFAMMELKSLIARLLYDFRLEPIDRLADLKLTADIVIRPLKPIRIKFIQNEH